MRSVVYASLFEYPLTLDQLSHSLLESGQTPSEILATYYESGRLRASVEYREGFFFRRGRYDLVEMRRRREQWSLEFLERHRRLLTIICALPYVRLVALSGSIAHLNLERDGDLDLFIVARGHHVWSVTVTILLLAKLLRRRRTVCANFVVSDRHLALEQQDVFTANQIIHLKPLVGDDLYRDLIAANPFVRHLYPNSRPADSGSFSFRVIGLDRTKVVLETLLAIPSSAFETVCRRAYGRYLRGRAGSWRSPEQVRLEPDYLKLHTHSHRRSILDRFDAAMREALEADEIASAAPGPPASVAGASAPKTNP